MKKALAVTIFLSVVAVTNAFNCLKPVDYFYSIGQTLFSLHCQ